MQIIQIDAFAERMFEGNPAAVCLLTEFPSADWMQAVAAEMNLSETAFLKRVEEGFKLRWFTPEVEVDLCGHATLASAHFLWQAGELATDEEARFHTLSGLLVARRRDEWIEMDFPSTPPTESTTPAGLVEALGARPVFAGRNRFDWLMEVESEAEVRALQPDFQSLRELCERGVMVTSVADSEEFDFVSRFFAPAAGVDEDPVTGSAHCCLGPYWSAKLGKTELVGFQASRRGGVVRVRPQVEEGRVILAGRAVTVLRANLMIDPF
jgi:PhzF family phenazine biosynthesis protein